MMKLIILDALLCDAGPITETDIMVFKAIALSGIIALAIVVPLCQLANWIDEIKGRRKARRMKSQ